MWFEGMTCHECKELIAENDEARGHVGDFWFHTGEVKNCLVSYLRRRHEAVNAQLALKRPPGERTVKKPIWRFHRGIWR